MRTVMDEIDRMSRNQEVADSAVSILFKVVWALVRTYLLVWIVLALFVLVVGGLSTVFIHRAHAEDLVDMGQPVAKFTYVCGGLEYVCPPSQVRVGYNPAILSDVNDHVNALDIGDGDPFMRAYLKKERLIGDGIPSSALVWMQMKSNPAVGFLMVQTDRGDVCMCDDRIGFVQDATYDQYFTVVY